MAETRQYMMTVAARRPFFPVPLTPAWRAILGILTCAPFFAWRGTYFWPVLQSPELLATTRPAVMAGVMGLVIALTLIDSVLLVLLWRRRHDPAPIPRLTLLVALVQAQGYLLLSFAFGNFTSPFAVTATVSVTVVGCALLGWRVALTTALINVPIALVLQGLINAKVFPYAPALPSASFVDGIPVAWWAAMRVQEFYVGVLIGGGLILWAFARFDRQRRELETLSRTDALTQISNRRHFMERLETELKRAQRYGQVFSVVLCDADHFKRVNDTFGHLTGDAVLRHLAQVLNGGLRVPADVAARLGGEEFALLLTDCDAAEAVCVGERLRGEAAAHEFGSEKTRFAVTMSMGVATWRSGSAEALLRQADARLYAAKAGGRDCVVGEAAEIAA
jgi:diguanylate cyclase (GGDEF)-like protein